MKAMRDEVAVVLIVVLVVGGFLVVSKFVDAEHADPCAPDGYSVDFGPGFLPGCYSPGPTLQFYDGRVVTYCAEAEGGEDCFVYSILTPEDRAAYEASLNATETGP